MNKYFEEWNGKKFPVREIQLPEELGGYDAYFADIDLWNAIENDYNNGNSEAHALDNYIYFYLDSGFIASDPTDEEIVEYLIEHWLI
jgi:hypothetical protein